MTIRRTMLGISMAALLTVAMPAAQKRDAAESALRTAMDKETIDGDLRVAAAMYRKIITVHKDNRAVVAKALVRLAECAERLGEAEARQYYERIIRDFSDQKDAVAVARARLAGQEAKTASRGDRPVWTGPNVDVFGRISPDGRYLTYVDWFDTGNLMLHDMQSGADHALTKNRSWTDPGDWAEYSVFSRDGRQVAYAWGKRDGGYELRIAPLLGATLGEPRHLRLAGDGRYVRPFDWSPDGNWIAVTLPRTDQLPAQMGVVSTRDGSLKVLRSTDWIGPENLQFSADGRFVVFDLPTPRVFSPRDLFAEAVDGSGGSALVAGPSNDMFVGFSADGRQMLFSSDRAGTRDLWAQAYENGKVTGAPRKLKSDFGTPEIHGLSRAGTLYVTKVVSDEDIHVVPVDLGSGRLSGEAIGVGKFPTRGRPDWSPDGNSLSYVDCSMRGAGPCTISIRRVDTGKTRELAASMHYIQFPRWSPDGLSLISGGTDLDGRPGLFKIDLSDGRTTRVGTGRFPGQVEWSADGGKVYFRRGGAVFERDLSSGAEREVLRHPGLASANAIALSPDGKQLAFTTVDGTTKSSALVVVPAGGGESRELLRANPPESIVNNANLSWTLGGTALVVAKRLTVGARNVPGPRELWLVPADGGAPRKLEIDANDWNILGGVGVRVSPGGRYMAYMAGKSAFEVWALENVLPASAK